MKQIMKKSAFSPFRFDAGFDLCGLSPALPQMVEHFGQQGYAASQVELLITITSLFIMVGPLANPSLSAFSQREAWLF